MFIYNELKANNSKSSRTAKQIFLKSMLGTLSSVTEPVWQGRRSDLAAGRTAHDSAPKLALGPIVVYRQ